GSGGGAADFTFGVHREAVDRTGWRVRDDAHGICDFFRIVIEQCRNMFFPLRAVRTRPPVETRFGFPGQPDFARVLGQEVHLLEALGDAKAPRPITHDHDVVGALHHRFGQPRHILDAPHGGHTARAARWAVHHAGVEFNFTLLVGQAAVAYAVIVGIVFHDSYSGDGRVERIAAGFQDLHALLEGVQAVGRRNDQRPCV